MAHARPVELPMEARFEQWIAHHGRVYQDASEKARRFDIFKANVERIDSVNADERLSYKLRVNQFADRTRDEMNSRCCGRRSKAKKADSFREELPPRQLAQPRPIELSMEALFEQWVAHHGRVYQDAVEKARRFDIFKANVERIDSVNADESLSNEKLLDAEHSEVNRVIYAYVMRCDSPSNSTNRSSSAPNNPILRINKFADRTMDELNSSTSSDA